MTEEQEQPGFAKQARARLGTVLSSKYRLERLLGVGGMASVYAATHRNGNRVAVKMLHGPLALDPDVRRRFLREGLVANRVNHPGAVQVTDDCEAEDGSAYLVMELLEGESLDVRWNRFDRRMLPREVLAITHELLDALGAAHANGIVHRDIKPANIFLTREGKVKVLDFGIARLLEATQGHAHTHTGRAVGTPAFMPPEQALGKTREIDGKTDLWAVGATMFTLLSGQDVHQAENVSEQLVFAATKPSRSLLVASPEMAPAIVQVVDRAISFGKERRWADAREMRDVVAEAHQVVFGEPIAHSIEQLRTIDSLGPVRSASPRAFAPTVRSVPPPMMADGFTEPSSEVRPSQMGSGQPTTGGGAFSLEGRRPPSLIVEPIASSVRRRSVGLGLAAVALAILGSVSILGYRSGATKSATVATASSPPRADEGASGAEDLATAMPVDLPLAVPAADPASVAPQPAQTSAHAAPPAIPPPQTPATPAPQPSPATAATAGGRPAATSVAANSTAGARTAKPPTPASAAPSSTAASVHVVETVPY